MKKSIYCLFLLCCGIVIGTLIAALTKDVSSLSWLSYGLDFGLTSPLVLDLAVMKFTFGLSFSLNVAVVMSVLLSFVIGLSVWRRW